MTLGQGFSSLVLRAEGLCCRRGGAVLAEGLDFSVGPGEALVLRGPNGAGKTTLLLTLFGALAPASGRFGIEGADPEAGPLIHLFAHQGAVKPRLSLVENLGFWAAVNGGEGIGIEAALETVGLGGLGRFEAGRLSAGQTRRLALARLLVGLRPVWLLDEPTAALDAEGEAMAAGLIGAHLASGGLAVIASHLPLPIAAGKVRELRMGS